MLARDKVAEYLRKELLGPRGGDNEFLYESPFNHYLTGILSPKFSETNEVIMDDPYGDEVQSSLNLDEDEADDALNLTNQLRPSSAALSFFVQTEEGSIPKIQCSISAGKYEKFTKKSITKNVDEIIDTPLTQKNDGDFSLPGYPKSFFDTILNSLAPIEGLHEVRLEKDITLAEIGDSLDFDRSETAEAVISSAEGTRPWWRRIPLIQENIELGRDDSEVCLGALAKLVSRWRPTKGGFIVSCAVINNNESKSRISTELEHLFQVNLSCVALNGHISAYPKPEIFTVSEEEEELELRYLHETIYAVGHGCSANWSLLDENRVKVETSFVPATEVPAYEYPESDENNFLQLSRLREADKNDLKAILGDFVNGYEGWLKGQQEIGDSLTRYQNAAERILKKIEYSIHRMREGIELLDDPNALNAFQLAHEVMIRQMMHSSSGLGGGLHSQGNAPAMPENYSADTQKATSRNGEAFSWRPFQLGYILLCLSSTLNPEDHARDEVDLIWASTGAGKTEAYLALAAMEIIHRRLTEGDAAGGTTVITRYTLRLLTQQQFERTARLSCALESLRTEQENLGDETISIGLWIGPDTPNKFSEAIERVEEFLADPINSSGFQVMKCPWCGTKIFPETANPDEPEKYGVEATNNSFEIFCTSPRCNFSRSDDKTLPIQVVDEALYKKPPTIIIGTIDKFARLAWLEGPSSFFGKSGDLPPTLIIQDELHLLEGPLGSTSGIYEAAIGTICELRGRKPKILASTATIREAESQIASIYGRRSHLFPSSGISAKDSYFTRLSDGEVPGRLYMGVMSPTRTPKKSFIDTTAALLNSVFPLQLEGLDRDAYWTVIAYHNSKRELGGTITAASDDIPTRLEWLQYLYPDVSSQVLSDDDIVELSANLKSSEIPANLARLSKEHHEQDSVRLVACTKMFSTGVDVQRLGLMIVNGQPMNNSEYIQATSRVGRRQVESPGLVVTHYSSNKPRDRSHYERFKSYHSALYKWVEPTSVTPFSSPSRKRSLPATLVILMRHGAGLSKNDDASKFDSNDPGIKKAIDAFLQRAAVSDPKEKESTKQSLEKLIEEWEISQEMLGDRLVYVDKQGSNFSLIKSHSGNGDGWAAMNSMRNVDISTPLNIITRKE